MAARLPRKAFFRSPVLRWVLLGIYMLVVLYFFWGIILGTSEQEKYAALTAFAVILASQVLFVLSFGTRDLHRPVASEHRLFWPGVLAGGMLAVLAVCFLTALHEFFEWAWYPASLFYFFFFVLAWLGLCLTFYLQCKKVPRYLVFKGLTVCLLLGSLLELFFAIPVHIIASRRHGGFDDLYIGMALAVSFVFFLWAFGPGIAILFLAPKYEREAEGAASGGPIASAPLKRWNFSLGSLAILVLLLGSVMAVLAIDQSPGDAPTKMFSRPEAWCVIVFSTWFTVRLLKRLRRWEKEE